VTLKSGNAEAIQRMFSRMRAEARSLLEEAVQLAWFMRGSVQYEDIKNMTPIERDIVKEFITNHMEQIKKHQFPVY